MIQPLRRLHSRAFVVLTIVVPTLFVSGVASRRLWPKAVAVRSQTGELTRVAEQILRASNTPVRLSTFRDREGVVLQISSLNAPDVLVYASAAEGKNSVSSDATLLGEYAPYKLFRLPAERARFVVLYSLAHQQVLASFDLGENP